jgi:anti-sigma B factor antagonist
MQVGQETRAGHLILTPDDSLMCGGRAEQFEATILQVVRGGQRHLIVDMARVAHIDSGGIRALVLGDSSAKKQGGSVSLVNVNATVRRVLAILRLDTVLHVYESLAAALADVAGA